MKVRRQLLLVVLITAWLSNGAVAQNRQDSPSSKILNLEQEWNAAYLRGDVAAMNSLLADDFIITTEDGKTYSKSGYIALNGNTVVHVEVSEMSDLKVRMYGSATAVVTGEYREKGTNKGKPYEYHDRFTDVWMNMNGSWQVIVSHYSIPAKE